MGNKIDVRVVVVEVNAPVRLPALPVPAGAVELTGLINVKIGVPTVAVVRKVLVRLSAELLNPGEVELAESTGKPLLGAGPEGTDVLGVNCPFLSSAVLENDGAGVVESRSFGPA